MTDVERLAALLRKMDCTPAECAEAIMLARQTGRRIAIVRHYLIPGEEPEIRYRSHDDPPDTTAAASRAV